MWSDLLAYLDVNRVALTVLGYPLSYIELLGTIFNLWSVWLVARNRIATWPIGIVGVVLFLLLFYQIRLYSDTFEQVYYLVISFYGWWQWSKAARADAQNSLLMRYSSRQAITTSLVATLVISVAAGVLVSRLHLWLPAFFPEPASYPYLDALTTIMSFTATFLMAQKRIECWYYWIAVDVIGIWLYYVKDVRFIALLYVVFLCLAVNGLAMWLRGARNRLDQRGGHGGTALHGRAP